MRTIRRTSLGTIMKQIVATPRTVTPVVVRSSATGLGSGSTFL
ncbi:hypothetical protein [Streptosporangium sp. NPDC002607]